MLGIFKNQGTTAQNVGYSSYVALLSQTGTDAPSQIVLNNTISDSNILWQYTGVGIYTGTLSGAFITNKTTAIINPISDSGTGDLCGVFIVNENTIIVSTTTQTTITPKDEVLFNTKLEITVYP